MATLVRDCPHCDTTAVAFTLVWAAQYDQQLPDAWNCAATCGVCRSPVCLVAYDTRSGFGSTPMQMHGSIDLAFNVTHFWPETKDLAAPRYVPSPVAKRFIEGEDAFRRSNWNSAVAMYRSALDIGTRALDGAPTGVTFYTRLAWLAENQRITSEIRSWADHVRVEGNAALHDPDDFDQEDAKALRYFTEMFLRYVFELPGEVRAFRGETST